MANEGRIAAFFDFDKTVISKSTAVQYMYFNLLKKHISYFFFLKFLLYAVLFKLNILKFNTIIETVSDFYKGRSFESLEKDSRSFHKRHIKPYYVKNMLKIIEEHREKGHILVLCSAGMDYLLKYPVNDINFDFLLSSRMELDEERKFTGKFVGTMCIGKHKEAFITRLAERENIDLKRSYAYSDHHSDYHFLKSVGHPIVVEPTPTLRKIALKEGWPILRHRRHTK